MTIIKRAKITFIAFSVLLLILGVCLIVWPEISAATLCWIFGILLVVLGATQVVWYFSRTLFGIPFVGMLANGVLTALLGVMLLLHTGDALVLMPIIVGFYFIMDGTAKLQTSVEVKRRGLKSWWLVLALAVLTILCGIALMLDPFDGVAVLMIVLGASLIIDAVQNLCVVLYISKLVKDEMPIEADYTVE